jgi:hypothetical protein
MAAESNTRVAGIAETSPDDIAKSLLFFLCHSPKFFPEEFCML